MKQVLWSGDRIHHTTNAAFLLDVMGKFLEVQDSNF